MPLKHIHLFRGQNTLRLNETLNTWKKKFIEKHGEMNLAEISKQDIYENILSDCISPGFMGMTRMIVLRDLLLKTEKEKDKIEERKLLLQEQA